ncbi:MAG TPA: hypothetical protein VMW10_02175 [Alphaproteobacteria bacterium]|nr:hypothetical protein [Alphaproteobacteria bacterium]
MLKKSSIYSFLTPIIAFAFLASAPCHSMEDQPKKEGTHVVAKATDQDFNESDSSKTRTFPIRTSPDFHAIYPNTAPGPYRNSLKGIAQCLHEENSKTLDAYGYTMSPSGDLVNPEGPGKFNAIWANTKGKIRRND